MENKNDITIVEESKNTSRSYLMQFFSYAHLPLEMQAVSRPFGELAKLIDDSIPNNQEKTTALRKLLEAKDCAVRAKIFKGN